MNKKHVACLVILGLAFGAVFFTLRVLQAKSFFSYEWEDDARDNQLVYNIATSFQPYQTVFQRDVEHPKILNDHFTPFHFIIALFYRIYPHIYTWYFLICFLYGLSSLLIYKFAEDVFKSGRIALLMALIYLIYPPLHYNTLGALDPRNFVLPLFLGMFYSQQTRKFGVYWMMMVLACLCKEDIPLFVFAFGLYQLVQRYPKKWWLSSLIFSLVYFVLAVHLSDAYCLIDARERGGGSILTKSYDYLSWDAISHILQALIHEPAQMFRTMGTWPKMRFFVMVLYPLAFLPLLSLEFYLGAVIVLFEVGLPNGFYNDNSYYAGTILPFAFAGLCYVLKRAQPHFKKGSTEKILMALIAVCIVGSFTRNIIGVTARESATLNEPFPEDFDRSFLGVNNVFDKRFFTVDEEDRMALRMLEMVPQEASLVVTGDFLPLASSRRYVYELGLEYSYNIYGPGEAPPVILNADYILINRKCLMNGLGGHFEWFEADDLTAAIETLVREHHFTMKAQEGPFILLEGRKNV